MEFIGKGIETVLEAGLKFHLESQFVEFILMRIGLGAFAGKRKVLAPVVHRCWLTTSRVVGEGKVMNGRAAEGATGSHMFTVVLPGAAR